MTDTAVVRRGRPPGSKNRPKPDEAPKPQTIEDVIGIAQPAPTPEPAPVPAPETVEDELDWDPSEMDEPDPDPEDEDGDPVDFYAEQGDPEAENEAVGVVPLVEPDFFVKQAMEKPTPKVNREVTYVVVTLADGRRARVPKEAIDIPRIGDAETPDAVAFGAVTFRCMVENTNLATGHPDFVSNVHLFGEYPRCPLCDSKVVVQL